jgi:hypothetical protein
MLILCVLLSFLPVMAVYKIVDDFQVNENVGTSRSRGSPAMACDKAGNTVLAWIDSRNYDTGQVFFQRYDFLNTAIGKNTAVTKETPINDNVSGTSVAMNERGQFCIVWNRKASINYQKYNSDGTVVNGNMSLNVIANGGYIKDPCIAMDASGQFVIAWLNKNVYFQRFDQNGDPLGESICVNPEVTVTDLSYYPSIVYVDIAMDSKGNFAIVWTDSRNKPNEHVFCRLYRKTGQPGGSAFGLSIAKDFVQLNGVIAYDAGDNFVIAWMDERSGRYAIWAQRFDSAGHAIGRNFHIGFDGNDHVQNYPSISRKASGEFVVIWLDAFDNGLRILGQHCAADGSPRGEILNVTEKMDTWVLTAGNRVRLDEQGNFKIAWKELRDDCWGLYYKVHHTSGQVLVSEIKVNDDLGSNPQTLPSIAMNNSGDFTIVWEDYRNSYGRLWCQSYNRYGRGVSNAFRMSLDNPSLQEGKPLAVMVDEDRLAVLWQDCTFHDFTICGSCTQVVTTEGTAVTPISKDDTETRWRSIAGSGNGRFVQVWWEMDPKLKIMIVCQRFDSLGQTVGEKLKVNDGTAIVYVCEPFIIMNGKGEFIVFWQDYRTGMNTRFFQRFDSDGKAVGNNTPVSDQQIDSLTRSAAMNDDGYFVAAWLKHNGSNTDIFYRRFSPDGQILEGNVKVNDNPPDTWIANPAVAMAENGDFVFVWDDERNGAGNSDIYCQRYRADGTQFGNNFRVNGDNTTTAQTNPNVAFKNDIIVTAWQTHHNEGQSWDVYANLIQFSEETAVDDNRGDIPESFELLQNHPNPFNAQTMIHFVMPVAGKIHLGIYNLLGQEVAVLIDGELTSGQHKIRWDALNVKSGVYICRLTTQNRSVCRKLTVIK